MRSGVLPLTQPHHARSRKQAPRAERQKRILRRATLRCTNQQVRRSTSETYSPQLLHHPVCLGMKFALGQRGSVAKIRCWVWTCSFRRCCASIGAAASSGGVSLWWCYENELLRNVLDDAIRQSAWFVALMRPGYVKDAETGIPTWVRYEWTEAGRANIGRRRDRMSRVAVVLGEQPGAHDWIDPDQDKIITVQPDASASTVAQHLLALLPASL